MRTLPVFAVQPKGIRAGAWEADQRRHHLLSILRCYQTSAFANSLARSEKHAAQAAAAAAARAALAANAAQAEVVQTNGHAFAHAAAIAATHAAHSADAAAASAAAASAAAAANAAGAANAQKAKAAAEAHAAALDLDLDLGMSGKKDAAGCFLARPLWPADTPLEIKDLWDNLSNGLRRLHAGFDIWIDWYEDRLDGKPLIHDIEESWALLSDSRLAQSPSQVNAYLKRLLQGEATEPLNRARAIFIGYGGVGKTSLIRALRGEPVVEGKEAMTQGLAIQDASLDEQAGVFTDEALLEGSALKVHFWDFGGQVMAHATHRFFLREQCLYVIVLDARKERNANEEAEYWLEHVRAFGKNAPVMLVGNKSDQSAVNLDLGTLRTKHPNVVGFYPLSCIQAKGRRRAEFERFDTDFKEELAKLSIHAERFTKSQFDVLKTVQSRAVEEDFLLKEDFDRICNECEVDNDGPSGREALLSLFDNLGIIIHFPRLPFLRDFVLNPRWLTYGVYKIIYSERARKAKGRIKEEEVVKILEGVSVEQPDGRTLSFPAERLQYIVDAMVAFGVAYRLARDPKRLVIPALLEPHQPGHDFKTEGALAFQFDFKGFLPRHVLPTLIVDQHHDIARHRKTGAEIVWQNGVLLHPVGRLNAEALITADYHERNLNILARGQDAATYLGVIRDAIRRTLLAMSELPYDEKVQLRPEMRVDTNEAVPGLDMGTVWIAYGIVESAQRNMLTAFPGPDGYMYDLGKVLGSMPAPSRMPGGHSSFSMIVHPGAVAQMSVIDRSPSAVLESRATAADVSSPPSVSPPQPHLSRHAMPESLCIPPATAAEEEAFAGLPDGPRQALRGVLDELKVWPVGEPIEVSFDGGSEALRQTFVEAAGEWAKAAMDVIRFDFGSAPAYRDHRPLRPAQIRVGFERIGNWSYVGIDSAGVDALKNGVSLNIGEAAGKDPSLVDHARLRGVMLHEIGHALGLTHEHQSPESNCEAEFDWEAIYAWLGGPPNNWPREEVDRNLRALVRHPRLRATEYDPLSIMHYALPASMFKNAAKSRCFVPENRTLSKLDRQIIQSAYPATGEEQQAHLKTAGKRVGDLLEQSGISQSQAKAIAELAASMVKQSYPKMTFEIDLTNVREDNSKLQKFTQIITGNNSVGVMGKHNTVTIHRK